MASSFVVIADQLALDFVNTEVWEGGRVDRLQGEHHLWMWARDVGVVCEAPSLPVEASLPEEVRALRAALRGLFEASIAGTAPAAEHVRHVDEVSRHTPAVRWDGTYGVGPVGRLDELLAVVARSGLELLMGPHRDRIKGCDGHHCILLFVDRSRSRRRRWCSMELCGNRAKVAAWRDRQPDGV